MGLDFAINELLATDWRPETDAACSRTPDGRAYPSIEQVWASFAEEGVQLRLIRVDAFDCWRAEWGGVTPETDAGEDRSGGVVGQTAEEAAVYALAQMRRQIRARADAPPAPRAPAPQPAPAG